MTERWTAPRLAFLIERSFGIRLHPRYVNQWLTNHGVTPQIPERQPRERNQALIDAWTRYQWPRIKKRRVTCAQP
jgi:transposase